MKVVFLRSDGSVVTNAIVRSVNKKNGEVLFMEIIGMSAEVKGGLKLKGKNTFKRLFIKRVYPHLEKGV